MNQESFFSEYKSIILPLIGAFVIGLLWYIVVGHDIMLNQQTSEKNMVNIIHTSNDCSFLRNFYGDAKDKWLKSSDDIEAIKRMEELKC